MNRQQLITILNTSTLALNHALVELYALQTADEQASALTRHSNGVGFNATDADFLTSLARRVTAGQPLTDRQRIAARRAIVKYTRQLLALPVDWAAFAAPLDALETLAFELASASKSATQETATHQPLHPSPILPSTRTPLFPLNQGVLQ